MKTIKFISIILLLTAANTVFAVDYVDSEYVIPEHEKEGIIGTRCEESYVPVHSRELLQRVQNWARGLVLGGFAELAGYEFDFEAHDADVPHRGLYNFGFATATNCLEIDVITKAVSLRIELRVLAMSLAAEDMETAPDRFREIYTQLAEELEFSQYLSDLEVDPSSRGLELSMAESFAQ